MLIKQPKISIISREVTGYSGERLIAFFAVVETSGVPEVRFLGTRPAPIPLAQGEAVLALPGAIARRFGEVIERVFQSVIVSPLSTLAFLISQPTRAPNLA